MTKWAENDYEPTPDEITELFAFTDVEDGEHGVTVRAHGEIELLPSMERYIWLADGIFWGHRRVTEDGHIWLSWARL